MLDVQAHLQHILRFVWISLIQVVVGKIEEKLVRFVIWKFCFEMYCLKRTDLIGSDQVTNSTKSKSLDLDNFQNICIKYLYYKCIFNFGLKSLNTKIVCGLQCP